MRRPFAVLGLLAAVLVVPTPALAEPEPLLPDLQQETPYALGVATDGRRFHLGFASVVYNYGDGPLRIEGRRRSTRERAMQADQVVDRDDGSRQRVANVGRLRYVDSITHRHWHYLKFDTYSLRRPDGRLARPDQKTGFCLGDRLVAPVIGPLPGKPRSGEYLTHCGYDSPDLLEVEEGISVGYGDDYGPQLEGQFVDITRLPAGRYVLEHRVNADGALREKTLDNNSASVLIDVRWRRGRPRVRQVARCPLSATCPVAPEMTLDRAVRLGRDAFRRAYGSRPAAVECTVTTDGAARCDSPAGTVVVRYRTSGGRLYWTYTARGERGPRSGRVSVGLGRVQKVPVERSQKTGARTQARVAYCPLIGRG